MSHYDCKECDASPHEDHAPSCSKNPIPEWAVDRARRKLEDEFYNNGKYSHPEDISEYALDAIARLIAKYEPAPVDPDVEALERVLDAFGFGNAAEWHFWKHTLAQFKKEIAAAKERG